MVELEYETKEYWIDKKRKIKAMNKEPKIPVEDIIDILKKDGRFGHVEGAEATKAKIKEIGNGNSK